MPTYCYRHPDGSLIELSMTVAQMKRRQRRDGTLVRWSGNDKIILTRDIVAEHKGHRATPGTWPMVSTAAGVDATQVEEARAYAKRMGVPTEFTKDGDPILTGPEHRKRYCEINYLYDRNAGYSDPQRKLTDSQKQELRKDEANVDVI